jgi:hypothetical protein
MSISSLLTHCPGCESSLIQIESLHASGPESTLFERRCPECSHGDELDLPSTIADLLCQRAAELAACLHELADRLDTADSLWISEPL